MAELAEGRIEEQGSGLSLVRAIAYPTDEL
jgi:hypothetical protein